MGCFLLQERENKDYQKINPSLPILTKYPKVILFLLWVGLYLLQMRSITSTTFYNKS